MEKDKNLGLEESVEEWLNQCKETYQRELPKLRAEHSGEFVAINGEVVVEVANNDQYLFEKYLNLKARVEIFGIGYESDVKQDNGLLLPNGLL